MSRSDVSKADIIAAIRAVARRIDDNKEHLSRLDTEIGDGDHGFSMASGFNSLAERLDEFADLDIGQLLKKSGFELIKTMGGSAGVVFGTLLTGQAKYYSQHLQGAERLSLADVSQMLGEAIGQIKAKGKSDIGGKTMLDALVPAVAALDAAVTNGASFEQAFADAAAKAEQGAESTRQMTGKHGRSRYVGERGKGFMDPGAASTAVIFGAIADYLNDAG